MFLSNTRGSVLIMVYAVLGVLFVLSGIFLTRIFSDRTFFDINRERQEAFYLAEAAVDRGIAELNGDWSGSSVPPSAVALGRGEYTIDISTTSTTAQKTITAVGYVPNAASPRAQRTIEAIAKKWTPPGFFDKAIYSAHAIDLNGNSYVVNGDIIYADTVSDTDHVTGTVSKDASIAPLAQLDWAALRAIAVAQGNLYDAARIKAVETDKDSYPLDFWNSAPSDPGMGPGSSGYDGVPNVVYVEGDLVLNGNFGMVGGFFLVVGDVLTGPDGPSSTSINGNGTIDGSIYSTGSFRIKDGGGGLNVDGGVWAGLEARLNGSCTIVYDHTYMYAIKDLIDKNDAGSVVQLLSWREL